MSDDKKFPMKFPSEGSKANILDLKLMGKKRPADHDLEQIVLGALILDKNALTEVIEVLKTETFDADKHQVVFEAIKRLFEKSDPVDIMTVVSELRSMGQLDFVGGPYFITQLTSKVNSAANIMFHTRILVQYFIKRSLISIANETLTDAYEETTDVFHLLDSMEQSLFEVSELNIRKNYVALNEAMASAMKEMETLKEQKDGLTGVPSGFTDLDRVTSGWQRSDLVIIAARPAMGKTAFVLSSMRNAASPPHNKPVALFSLEMSAEQIVKRLMSSEAELESDKLKNPNKMRPEEWDQLIDKTSVLNQTPMFIDDTPGISILELRAKARRLKAQHDISLIIIDYLQLMTGESSKGGGGNREQEIAQISRSLKQLAKELNVPVIALSQLSRAVETRGGDKKPQLSDLRESGSIEQDADMVMFLYRPQYYGITEDEEGNPTEGLGEVIIAKHRNGEVGTVKLKFIGKYTKFSDWDAGEYFDGNDMMSSMASFDASSTLDHPGGIEPTPPKPSSNTITLGSKMNNEDDKPDLSNPPF